MSNKSINIFISYSHTDESFCLELQKHLSPLKRAKIITHWYDRKITPGSEWKSELEERLRASDIILFLISPDFLNSDKIYNHEVKIAMELHKTGKAIIVPVMLRRCDIESTQFVGIQGLPTNLEPVNSSRWYAADDAYFDIIEGLKYLIQKIKNKKDIWELDEKEWEKAKETHTSEAYLKYLEASHSKLYSEEAINRLKKLLLHNPVDKQVNKLDLEVLRMDRERYGMELHDSVMSNLIIASLNLSEIEEGVSSETFLPNDALQELRKSLSKAMSEIRRISHSLVRDVDDNEFNLKAALLELESSLTKVSSINFSFIFEGIYKLSNPQLGINIYRIIQELVTNIIKHSEASYADIKVSVVNANVYLTVKDNGIGFNKINEPILYGIGLENINQRVEYYNGEISITSSPGEGGTVKIIIPIDY